MADNDKLFDNVKMAVLGKLGNVLKKEVKAAGDPEPGEHEVDFLVHVKGGIAKGVDVEKMVPQTAKPWLLLAVALSKLNGVTVESLTQEALSMTPEMEKQVKTDATVALTKIKGQTTKLTKGAVRFKKGFEVKLVADAADVAEAEVEVA